MRSRLITTVQFALIVFQVSACYLVYGQPKDPFTLYEDAVTLYESGKYEEAKIQLLECDSLIGKTPKTVSLYLHILLKLDDQEQFRKAYILYELLTPAHKINENLKQAYLDYIQKEAGSRILIQRNNKVKIQKPKSDIERSQKQKQLSGIKNSSERLDKIIQEDKFNKLADEVLQKKADDGILVWQSGYFRELSNFKSASNGKIVSWTPTHKSFERDCDSVWKRLYDHIDWYCISDRYISREYVGNSQDNRSYRDVYPILKTKLKKNGVLFLMADDKSTYHYLALFLQENYGFIYDESSSFTNYQQYPKFRKYDVAGKKIQVIKTKKREDLAINISGFKANSLPKNVIVLSKFKGKGTDDIVTSFIYSPPGGGTIFFNGTPNYFNSYIENSTGFDQGISEQLGKDVYQYIYERYKLQIGNK